MNEYFWSVTRALLFRASFAFGVFAWAALTFMAWRASPEPATKDDRVKCDIFCGAVD